MKKLKEAYSAKDLAAIDTAQAALNAAWTAASEDMYKASAEGAQQAPPTGDAGAGHEQNTDHVTDVDFEEVK